jgi:hypothetical protein
MKEGGDVVLKSRHGIRVHVREMDCQAIVRL